MYGRLYDVYNSVINDDEKVILAYTLKSKTSHLYTNGKWQGL